MITALGALRRFGIRQDGLDVLGLPVLLLEQALHVEVKLALLLDALLFHVTDDALVHGLQAPLAGLLPTKGP